MLKRFGLSKLLWGLILSVTFVTVMMGLVLSWSGRKTSSHLAETSEKTLALVGSQSRMVRDLSLVHSNALPILNETNVEDRDLRVELMNGFVSEVKKGLVKCGIACDDLEKDFEKYHSQWNDIYENLVLKGEKVGATQALIAKLNPLIEVMFEKIDKIAGESEKNQKAAQESVLAEAKKTELWILGVIVICVAMVIISGMWVRSFVLREISKVTVSLAEASKSADHLSHEIKESSDQLNDSSQLQAAAVQETVASMDEIMAMVQKSLELANESQSASGQSEEAVANGQETVKHMISAIEEINVGNGDLIGAVQEANTELSGLMDMIIQISSKTKIINDIVFQTKLLSFNASIEAARAGEAGKGFSVVAEEVGRLAQTSGQAALEISSIVESSVSHAKAAVDKIKRTAEVQIVSNEKRIKAGTEYAHSCGQSLSQIKEQVGSVASMIQQVYTSSNEQSAGITNIGDAMKNVDQSSQKNASMVVHFDKSSQELAKQVQDLKHLSNDLMSLVYGRSWDIRSSRKAESQASSDSNESDDIKPYRDEGQAA